MSFVTAVAAALALVGPAEAGGQATPAARQPTQYSAEDQIALDPTRAYIFYRTQYRTTYRFLREPDQAELAEHAARRARELAEAIRSFPRRLRRWEEDRKFCLERRQGNCATADSRPVLPTEENFAIEPPELDNFVGNELRPRLEFADDQASGWLIAVQPGSYVVYGPIAEGPNGKTGGCYCMGSVRFEAAAGQITSLGEIRDDISMEEAQAFVRERGGNAFRLGHGVVAPLDQSKPLPAQFAGLQVIQAQLRAADKMPNYFGVFISRIAPIPGVLEYRRDVVIDARTGRPVDGSVEAAGTR